MKEENVDFIFENTIILTFGSNIKVEAETPFQNIFFLKVNLLLFCIQNAQFLTILCKPTVPLTHSITTL